MSWSYSVRVVDEDGEPVSGKEVEIIFYGILGGFLKEYTDDDGWASFEIDAQDSGSRMHVKTLYVDGEEVAESFMAEDGETASFTVS